MGCSVPVFVLPLWGKLFVNKLMRLSYNASRFSFLIVLAIILLLTTSIHAIDQRTPEQIVEETSSQVLRVLNDDNDRLKEDPSLINDLINETVIPIIDLNSMGKLILGKYWKTASEEQRAKFITEFKDMLIRTYAKSLVDYGHAKVKVLPNRGKKEGKYRTVQTELDIGSGKTPLQVAYVFRNNKEKEWKVFDLAVDGLSLIKNFRTSFGQEIKETSLDALIERLATTNQSGATDELQAE